jgi:hypothetical protein
MRTWGHLLSQWVFANPGESGPDEASVWNNKGRMTLAERLSEIALPDADGRAVRLGSLWETRSAVVVFLRHYG